MEKKPRHWLRYGIAAAIIGMGFLLPIRFRVNVEFLERLMDFLHLPVFVAVTWFLFAHLPATIPRPARIGWATFLAAALAAGIERLQEFTGREASMNDFKGGVAGSLLAAFALAVWLLPMRRFWIGAVALLGLLVSAVVIHPAWTELRAIRWRSAHLPLLADFEESTELPLWQSSQQADAPRGAEVARTPQFASHGAWSLRVSTQVASYPGARYLCGEQDWRGRRALVFDVYNTGAPFDLGLRIDDDFPNPNRGDRFSKTLPLAAGWNHFQIPIAEIAATPNRPLNLVALRRIVFFLDSPKEPHIFHLDHLRLE